MIGSTVIWGISPTNGRGLLRRFKRIREFADLPADIDQMLRRHDELLGKAPVAPEKPSATSHLVANGMDADEAVELHDKYTAALDRHQRSKRANEEAVRAIDSTLDAKCHRECSDLIEQWLQPLTTSLIDKARKPAQHLQRFYPNNTGKAHEHPAVFPIWRGDINNYGGFNETELLYESSNEEHTAFLKTVEPQRQFNELTSLWLELITQTTMKGGGGSKPQAVGGSAVWERPELVADPFLKGRGFNEGNLSAVPIPMKVLTIASASENAGFRLTSPRQIQQRIEREHREREQAKQNTTASVRSNTWATGANNSPEIIAEIAKTL